VGTGQLHPLDTRYYLSEYSVACVIMKVTEVPYIPIMGLLPVLKAPTTTLDLD
jgi:hypothetical protein